jgi:hypothetical protein
MSFGMGDYTYANNNPANFTDPTGLNPDAYEQCVTRYSTFFKIIGAGLGGFLVNAARGASFVGPIAAGLFVGAVAGMFAHQLVAGLATDEQAAGIGLAMGWYVGSKAALAEMLTGGVAEVINMLTSLLFNVGDTAGGALGGILGGIIGPTIAGLKYGGDFGASFGSYVGSYMCN